MQLTTSKCGTQWYTQSTLSLFKSASWDIPTRTGCKSRESQRLPNSPPIDKGNSSCTRALCGRADRKIAPTFGGKNRLSFGQICSNEVNQRSAHAMIAEGRPLHLTPPADRGTSIARPRCVSAKPAPTSRMVSRLSSWAYRPGC